MRIAGVAVIIAALVLACPGPEPHLRATAGDGGNAGSGGEGGSGASGGEGGAGGGSTTCGNGVVDSGELCFHPLLPVPGGSNVGVGAIFDVDGDGDLDITGLGANNNVLYGFLAEPAGSFGMPATLATGIGFGRFGHFTNDALDDLIVMLPGPPPEVAFLANTDNASFASPVVIEQRYNVTELVVGDIDDDGLDDFVLMRCTEGACTSAGATWFVYMADTDPFSPTTTMITGDPSRAGVLVPLDSDPLVDLVALDILDDEVQVFLNTGGVLAGSPVPEAIEPGGTNPNGIAVLDIDGMGGPELAITHGGTGNTIAIMSASNAGAITPFGSVPVAGSQYAPHLLDLDNDSNIDLVALVEPEGGGDRQVVVARGDGTGIGEALVILEDPLIFRQLKIADLDGDGAYDLAIRSTDSTGILLLMSNP